MGQNNFGRKKRQLKVLVEKLHHLVLYHRREAETQIQKLIHKIKTLVQELAVILSQSEIKKILGMAAVVIGISFTDKLSAQSFAAPVANPFGLQSANYFAFPAFADLDGDGDLDVLVGEYYGYLRYFQNTGTALSPHFAQPQINPFGLVAANLFAKPSFADLDGDGDLDLLVGEYLGNLKYFKNIGTLLDPQFAQPQNNPFGLSATNGLALPSFADLDDDGDMDLLVGEGYGALRYFQNVGSDTTPQFDPPLLNPFGLDSTYYLAVPALADLDRDGDLDLLVGEEYGVMQYFQNTGSALTPKFELPVESPFGLSQTYYNAFPAFADLDSDGDSDLLVGEYYGVMEYFENLDLTGVADIGQQINVKLSPNPVNNLLHIDADEKIKKIEIFNILGEPVQSVNNPLNEIAVHNLTPGLYTLKITFAQGKFATRKIQKQ